MALAVFLKLADIKGESADAAHRDEIDVIAWDWGVEQGVAAIPGGGAATAGKPKFRNLRFSHRIDAASPLLMAACAGAKRQKEAMLTVRRAGDAGGDVMAVRLSDVLVASVNTEVNGANGDLFETVTLAFLKINIEYKPLPPDSAAVQFAGSV